MAWRGNDQLQMETELGGFRSNSGKNKQTRPPNYGYVRKVSFGLQAGLCSFEGFLHLLYSKLA